MTPRIQPPCAFLRCLYLVGLRTYPQPEGCLPRLKTGERFPVFNRLREAGEFRLGESGERQDIHNRRHVRISGTRNHRRLRAQSCGGLVGVRHLYFRVLVWHLRLHVSCSLEQCSPTAIRRVPEARLLSRIPIRCRRSERRWPASRRSQVFPQRHAYLVFEAAGT